MLDLAGRFLHQVILLRSAQQCHGWPAGNPALLLVGIAEGVVGADLATPALAIAQAVWGRFLEFGCKLGDGRAGHVCRYLPSHYSWAAVAGEPVLPRLHDQGFGLVADWPVISGELIDGQVGQVVAGCGRCARPAAISSGVRLLRLRRSWRPASRSLRGRSHRQQRILGARAQLVHGVFVKALDLQHFMDRHVGLLPGW